MCTTMNELEKVVADYRSLKSSHGYLPPSVANHKSVSVMVWMEEVV